MRRPAASFAGALIALIAATIFAASAQSPLAEELTVPILGSIQTPGLMSHSPYTFSHAETVTATAGLFGDYWKPATLKGVPSVFGGTITTDPDHYSVPLSNRLRQVRNGQLVLVN
jgi:hypothetical protein